MAGTSLDDHFTLQWNDYQNHLMNAFTNLRNDRDFVDLTLSCEGRKISSHKMLLSACSPYFRSLLKDNPCPHPVIILRQTSYEDLVAIIHFIYNGEVSLHQSRVKSFIKTAKSLKIRGLCEASDLGEDVSQTGTSTASTTSTATTTTPGGTKRPPQTSSSNSKSAPRKKIRPSGEEVVEEEEQQQQFVETESYPEGSWSYEYTEDGSINTATSEGVSTFRQGKRYTQKFRDKWLSDPEFEPWLLRHENDPEKAICSVCRKTMNAKLYDLRHHARSLKHRKNCGLATATATTNMPRTTTTTVIHTETGLDGQEIIIKETNVIEEEDDDEDGEPRLIDGTNKEVILQQTDETGEITAVIDHA